MSKIRDIRKAVDSALDHVQTKAEAAEVQVALGKMELEQHVQAQYEALTQAANELKAEIGTRTGQGASALEGLQTAADRLRVKAALGAMDSRDALESLDPEIRERIDQFEEHLDDIDFDDAVEDAADQIKESVERYARKASRLKSEIAARLDRLKD